MPSTVYDITKMAVGGLNYVQLVTYALITFTALLFISFQKKRRQLARIKKLNYLLSRQNYDWEIANKELLGSVKENRKITDVLAHDLRSSIIGVDMMIKSIGKKRQEEMSNRILVLQTLVGQYCRWLILNILDGKVETIFVKLSWVKVYDSFQAVLLQQQAMLQEKQLTVNLKMTDIKLESYLERLEKIFTMAIIVVMECAGVGDTIDINYFFMNQRPVIVFKNRKIVIEPALAKSYGLEIEETPELTEEKLQVLEKIMSDEVANHEGMILFEDKFNIGMIGKVYDPKFYFYYCI